MPPPVIVLGRPAASAPPAGKRPWLDVKPAKVTTYLEPISVPGNPDLNLLHIPFAPEPKAGKTVYWPIRTTLERRVAYTDKNGKPVGGGRGLAFGGKRGGTRLHVAIDLPARHHDVVVACEKGTIINYTGFYHGVNRCLVDHGDYVINYGEIEASSSCKRTGDEKKERPKKKDGKPVMKDGKPVMQEYTSRAKCPSTFRAFRCRSHCKGKRHSNPFVCHARRTHRVKQGETFASIAEAYGLDVTKLKGANAKLADPLKARSRVKLPRLMPGDVVEAGYPLGEIGRMNFEGMLHFEIYVKDTKCTFSWPKGKTPIEHYAKELGRSQARYEAAVKTRGKTWAKHVDPRTYNAKTKPTEKKTAQQVYLDPTRYLIYLAKHGE